MSSNEIRLHHVVDATPAAVWTVLTEIDRDAETLSGVSRVERVAGSGYEVGTRWRETRRMTDLGGSTDLAMTFSPSQSAPSGFEQIMMAVFGRLGMRVTAKVMMQDLADIAARAEAAR
ncbi:SRPBCC family protein [Prescottella agglutinans]|uniref:SRPBCC family protein n=1 Tax=Prescottella agglutinans TaxID=1644129 RepID=UPI001F4D9AC9|nr:SRPBCC family protein [Prescottella agglutinans]